MAMQNVILKEHEEIPHNCVGQLSFATSALWWSAFASQTVYGQSFDTMESFSLELPPYVDQLAASKQSARRSEQVLDLCRAYARGKLPAQGKDTFKRGDCNTNATFKA